MASRNSAKSSAEYRVGRHIRGLWLKIWIASDFDSTPRSTALAKPPAVETWQPISKGRLVYPIEKPNAAL